MIKWDCAETHKLFSFHPILSAAVNGHIDIVKFLAPLTKYPNTPVYGSNTTPIHTAASNGYLEIVKFLNLNFRTWDNKTAIELASENGHDEIVRVLKFYIENVQQERQLTSDYEEAILAF